MLSVLVLRKLFIEHVIISTKPFEARDGAKKLNPIRPLVLIKVCDVTHSYWKLSACKFKLVVVPSVESEGECGNAGTHSLCR